MGRTSVTGQRQSGGDFSAHAIMRHAPRNETLMRRSIHQSARAESHAMQRLLCHCEMRRP